MRQYEYFREENGEWKKFPHPNESPEQAIEQWIERRESEQVEYPVAGGDRAAIAVREWGTDEEAIVYTVTGEMIPVYSAHALRPTDSLTRYEAQEIEGYDEDTAEEENNGED